jgi:DNA (cytosine-5)-methyltransferase 1
MRVLELFAGYGSQALALENLGIDFTSDISEIDKYAIQAYNQLHGETHNWGDITKIDETKLPYYDLITYSSPCQDFSVAGLQKGGDKDSGTRSSLLWECERIIRAVKPKYLLMENVKNLVGKKHKHNFIRWLRVLEMMGYQNYWQVLNAKDYGVPQNRERVFVVSILGCGQYLFPNPIKLEKRLKDVLEPVVDEKYYLSQDKVDKLVMNMDKEVSNTIRCGGGGSLDGKHTWDIVACASRGRNPENPSDRTAGAPTEQRLEVNQTGCSNTITTVEKDNYVIQLGNIIDTDSFGGNPQAGRIYSTDGVSPTLNTMQGGQREPKILDDSYANRAVREYNEFSPTIRAEREGLKVAEGVSVNVNSRKAEFNGFKPISPALRATDYKCPHTYSNGYRIRKLTPLECWRLMGVKDEQFDKLHDISNTQLYKLASNSIVVDVLMGIFKNLLVADNGTKGQLTLL